jgi:hypothetical protein
MSKIKIESCRKTLCEREREGRQRRKRRMEKEKGESW